jgi:hypothetical protein
MGKLYNSAEFGCGYNINSTDYDLFYGNIQLGYRMTRNFSAFIPVETSLGRTDDDTSNWQLLTGLGLSYRINDGKGCDIELVLSGSTTLDVDDLNFFQTKGMIKFGDLHFLPGAYLGIGLSWLSPYEKGWDDIVMTNVSIGIWLW